MPNDKDIIDEAFEDFFEDEDDSNGESLNTTGTEPDVNDVPDTPDKDDEEEGKEESDDTPDDEKPPEEKDSNQQDGDDVPNYADDTSSIVNVVVGDLRSGSASIPDINFDGLDDSDEPVSLTASQLKEVLSQVYKVAVESAVKITSGKVQDHNNSVNEGRAFVESFFKKNPEMREHSKAFSTYVKLAKLENPNLPIDKIFGKAHTQFKSEVNVLHKQEKRAVKSAPPARKASAITPPPNNTQSSVPDTFAVFYED